MWTEWIEIAFHQRLASPARSPAHHHRLPARPPIMITTQLLCPLCDAPAAIVKALSTLGHADYTALLFDWRLPLILSYLIAPGYISSSDLSTSTNVIPTLNPDGYNLTSTTE